MGEQRQKIRRTAGRPGSAETARLTDAILAAAEAAFLTNGFADTSVEAVAAAAGTSKQTIYNRFGSKEDLFVAVSRYVLSDRMDPRPIANASLRDRLAGLAVQILDGMLDPRIVRMYSIFTAEAHRFPVLARMVDDDALFPRPQILALLAEGEKTGTIALSDLSMGVLMFQDIVLAAPLRSAELGLPRFDSTSLGRWTEMAVDLFLNGARPR